MRIISSRWWVRWTVGSLAGVVLGLKVLDYCSYCYNYIIGHGPSPNYPSLERDEFLAMSTSHRALLPKPNDPRFF